MDAKWKRIESVRFVGHGHYKVTISYYRKLYSAVITDMTLIDNYKDEDGTIEDKNWLYEAVKRKAINNQ